MDDFGLMECQQCGASLFVEFDGQVRLRDASQDSVQAPSTVESDGSATFAIPESMENFPMDPAPEIYTAPASEDSSDQALGDLEAYGNTEVSSATEGRLCYDLSIDGIDTSELRAAVKEALTDRLFMWDADQLARNIHGGSLKLEKISPVKASVLVNRLIGLPIRIEWVQHVVS